MCRSLPAVTVAQIPKMSQDGSYILQDNPGLHPNVTIRANNACRSRDTELQTLIRERKRLEKKIDEQVLHIENLISAAEIADVVNEELGYLEDWMDNLQDTHQRLVTLLGDDDHGFNPWAEERFIDVTEKVVEIQQLVSDYLSTPEDILNQYVSHQPIPIRQSLNLRQPMDDFNLRNVCSLHASRKRLATEVPTSDKIQKWSYLEAIKDEVCRTDKLKVGVLIRANSVWCKEPLKVIKSQEDGPYAFRTKIGWCLVGSLELHHHPTSISCNTISTDKHNTRATYAIKDMIKEDSMPSLLRKVYINDFMADLQEKRTTEVSPFTHCGIDMFGPFLVKERRYHLKKYTALFTCFSARAIRVRSWVVLATSWSS